MPNSAPRRDAFLAVLDRAIIDARLLAYRAASENEDSSSRKKFGQIAALMDAVHNIPQALETAEVSDAEELLRDLQTYDETYADGPEGRSVRLASVYRDRLDREPKTPGES